jgi:hypothetical protein
MQHHQGRLIDHIHLRVRDIEAMSHDPTERSAESVVVRRGKSE